MTDIQPKALTERCYHHGDLRAALLTAAAEILAERGAEGFTLRECARRAGVSSVAPSHHFANAAGLLAAVATLGFDELSDSMEAVAEASDGMPAGRLEAICHAYVAFALRRSGRFRVTFGPSSRPGGADTALEQAAGRAFRILDRAARAALQDHDGDDATRPIFVWSVVHGLATLLLDGRLDFLAGGVARNATAASLVPAVLARLGHADDVGQDNAHPVAQGPRRSACRARPSATAGLTAFNEPQRASWVPRP